jgi:hypothetical protein
MHMKTLIVSTAMLSLAAGCQMGRHHTPGEQIVMSAPRTSQPDTTAPAPEPAPTPDVKPAPTPEPVAVVPSPATIPASTAPAQPSPRRYTAADADAATQFRNWPITTNEYANGNVFAGPVYRVIAPPPRSNRPKDTYATDFFQTFLTVPQMFATPVWMLFTPPGQTVEYHGDQFPPSYTVDDATPYYVDEKVPGIFRMTRK